MIGHILNILRRHKDEARATPEDYEAVFSSEAGQRVIMDLMVRYQVGKPSAHFDKLGRYDQRSSDRADVAKAIICDLVQRGKMKQSEAEKPTRSKRDKTLTKLPQASTSI